MAAIRLEGPNFPSYIYDNRFELVPIVEKIKGTTRYFSFSFVYARNPSRKTKFRVLTISTIKGIQI